MPGIYQKYTLYGSLPDWYSNYKLASWPVRARLRKPLTQKRHRR